MNLDVETGYFGNQLVAVIKEENIQKSENFLRTLTYLVQAIHNKRTRQERVK